MYSIYLNGIKHAHLKKCRPSQQKLFDFLYTTILKGQVFMTLSKLFTEAIRQGASSPTEVIHDLSALLQVAQAKESGLLPNIRSELAGDAIALGIVDSIEEESKKPGLSFGPVLLDTAGYIQRLTIFVEVEGFKSYPDGIIDFVEDSFVKDGDSLLKLFAAAEEVDSALPTYAITQKLSWRQEVIPCLLQQTLSDSSLLLQLAAAAVSTLPSGWEKVELWVSQHLDPTGQNKLPGVNSANDKGFFTRLRSNYQPIATHPLVLRILREPALFSKEKDSTGVELSADEVRLKFSEWLVNSAFDGSELLQDLPPECAFAAGAFVLQMARWNGVQVKSDGEISPSDNAWTSLTRRVLDRIVQNSESNSSIPSAWQNQQPLIRRIMSVCPEWQKSEVVLNLRSRATARLTNNLGELLRTFSEQTEKLTNDAEDNKNRFLPRSEKYAALPPPDLRPSIKIPDNKFTTKTLEELQKVETPSEAVLNQLQQVGGGWNEYIKDLRDRRKADDDLVNWSKSTQEIVKATTDVRKSFNSGIVSPFVESSLIELRIANKDKITNLALGSYFDRCIAAVSLDQLESDVSQIWQPFENQTAWKTWVNQPSPAGELELLQVWAGLEVWDGLRGRFLEIEERDRRASERLYAKAKAWLVTDPAATNVDELRPWMATIAHLGISVDDSLFSDLAKRLENVKDFLGQPLEALLIAVRFELGITAIAANTQPSLAFSTYLGDLKNQKAELLRCLAVVLKSPNAWEVRAGFNMLILLARLAESTGDLYLKAILYSNEVGRAHSLVATAITQLIKSSGILGISGLPLAIAGFDLVRSARESAQAIALENQIPSPWVRQLGTTTTRIANELTQRLISQGRSVLRPFASEGGLAAKNLVLALFQIKLDELQLAQQLTVEPLRSGDPNFKQLEELEKTMRSLFCGEQLLLNEPWQVSQDDEILPWWKAQYWFNQLASDQAPTIPDPKASSRFPDVLGKELDNEQLPESIQTALGLDTNDVMVRVQQWTGDTEGERHGVRWLLLGQQGSQEYVRILKQEEDGSIAVYTLDTPFCLFNWSTAYQTNAETSLLSQAAMLEAAVPIISDQIPQDVDGFYEGEFPGLSWEAVKKDLETARNALNAAEGDYKKILTAQASGDRTDQMISLLQQPLRLNTADYKEQILSAIADVRQAEAELEATEHESIASNFEVFANEYIYAAAQVEVQRQDALVEIQKWEEQVASKEAEISEINKKTAASDVETKQKNVDIAIKRQEQAEIRREQVKRAREVILQEIKLLKKLLEDEFDDPVTGEKKKGGQIGLMARQVENTLINQLREDLKKAEAELKKAEDAERERRKKEKRRRLINGICRFVGSVVGSIYGGPAGAALGAEIGGAIAEIANGVIDNKPPEQILTGLIDNGFAIAQAAGCDLEKELNTLGAKTAEQAGKFFNQLDVGLKPLLDSMPNILDEKLVSDAIRILDLGEIKGLEPLLKASYGDLKKDINNLGTLGTALKNVVGAQPGTAIIKVDDPQQLLDRLSGNLFQQTKGDLKQLKALAKSVGEKVENLDELTDKQQEELAELAADKLSKLVVSQVGQESINYRRDVITKWINSKRVPQAGEPKFWTDPTVQQEANALVTELFKDKKAGQAALDNIQASLLDPTVEQGKMRAKIQELLSPWQAELDEYLTKVTAVDKDAPAPKDAVQAAQANVNYLKNCLKKFDDELLPFLKGDKGTKRNELILKLDEQVRAAVDKEDDLKIETIETDISKLTVEQAETQLQQVQNSLEAIRKQGEIADIKVSQASIETKAVQLAKLRETNRENAQKNTLEAAKARREAAKARVKAAKARLESKQALAEGARKRGAEASRIRVLLSQPPLRLLDESQLETANARRKHAEALTCALKAYRELLRYFVAFQGNEPKFIDRPTTTTWSDVLDLKDVDKKFLQGAIPSAPDPITWELTPEQIASLFTPGGFQVIVGPQVPESEDFPLFSVSESWSALLTTKQTVIPEISPWREEFRRNGIVLSDDATTVLDGAGPNWKIVNYRQEPVSVFFYEELRRLDAVKWNIPLEAEPTVTYTVKKANGLLVITRRQRPLSEGRSPYNSSWFDFIRATQASKARVVGVLLSGNVGGSTQKLSSGDYIVEIEHSGDIYTSSKTISLHRPKKLSGNRIRFLETTTGSALQAIKEIQEILDIEGDPDPFKVTGTPLSGTTVIRFTPQGDKPFFNLKIQIVWKFYS